MKTTKINRIQFYLPGRSYSIPTVQEARNRRTLNGVSDIQKIKNSLNINVIVCHNKFSVKLNRTNPLYMV